MSINVIVIHEGVLPDGRDISRTRIVQFREEEVPETVLIEDTSDIAAAALETVLAPEMRTRLEREQIVLIETAQECMQAQVAERLERNQDEDISELPVVVVSNRPERT